MEGAATNFKKLEAEVETEPKAEEMTAYSAVGAKAKKKFKAQGEAEVKAEMVAKTERFLHLCCWLEGEKGKDFGRGN